MSVERVCGYKFKFKPMKYDINIVKILIIGQLLHIKSAEDIIKYTNNSDFNTIIYKPSPSNIKKLIHLYITFIPQY